MKLIANWFNYALEGNPRGEVFTRPSLTAPGQVLSLQQLLDRLVRGENVTQFNATYSDDPDLPDITGLDEQERLMLARDYAQLAEETKQSLRERRKREQQEQPSAASAPEPEASIM